MKKFRQYVEEKEGLGDVDPKSYAVADYGHSQGVGNPDISDVQQLFNDVISKNGRKFARMLRNVLGKGLIDDDPDFRNKMEEIADQLDKVKKASRGDDERMERGMKNRRQPDPYDNAVVRNPADSSGGAMGGNQGGGGE